jgi:transposase
MDDRLSDDLIATVQLAAQKLTSFERRQFLAEMAVKYCDGSPRKAEAVFGWGRDAVRTGLGEMRTGIRCLDNFRSRGRKKTEEHTPQLVEEIRRIVEPQAQADPKFQTTFAFTRITARAVRDELLNDEELSLAVPCRQTVGAILNRLGYRLRPVQKTRPEKKFPRLTTSSPMSTPAGQQPAKTNRR